MRERIRTAVRSAIENGTKKLRITYKREMLHGVYGIMSLANAQMITMSPGERMIAVAVVTSGDWENDDNRTFTIEFGPLFREELFVNLLADFLEKVAYAKPKQAA